MCVRINTHLHAGKCNKYLRVDYKSIEGQNTVKGFLRYLYSAFMQTSSKHHIIII